MYGVDPLLVKSIITKESNWKVDSSYSKEENNFFDCKNQKTHLNRDSCDN